MKKSEPPAGDSQKPQLDFPDWSGMDDSSPRITPEAAFRLCAQYRAFAAKAGALERNDRVEKCIVEFVL